MKFLAKAVRSASLISLLCICGCNNEGHWDQTKGRFSRLAEEGEQQVASVTGMDPAPVLNTIGEKGQVAYNWCRETGRSVAARMPRSEMEARKMFLSYFVGTTKWTAASVPSLQPVGNVAGRGGRSGKVPSRLSGRSMQNRLQVPSNKRRG